MEPQTDGEFVDSNRTRANGDRLGLLVDRKNRTVSVYRPGASPVVLENPSSVVCDPELPGFALQMAKIW